MGGDYSNGQNSSNERDYSDEANVDGGALKRMREDSLDMPTSKSLSALTSRGEASGDLASFLGIGREADSNFFDSEKAELEYWMMVNYFSLL